MKVRSSLSALPGTAGRLEAAAHRASVFLPMDLSASIPVYGRLEKQCLYLGKIDNLADALPVKA